MNRRNQKYVLGFLILSFGLVFAMIYMFFNYTSAYKLSEDAFKIIAGQIRTFEEGTEFIYDETGPTYKGASDNEYFDATPFYLEDGSLLIIPETSVYVDARNVLFFQVPSFSEVTCEGATTINNADINDGFIYDGKNIYTFLDEMVITINGVEIELGRYSSISLSTNGLYVLYNTADESVSLDYVYTDTLVASCTDYTVDVLNDILYPYNGDGVLLFTKPDLLEVIE